jgi:hypothetical protein
MFAWFERRIDPFKPAPVAQPPEGLAAFYWHFIRGVTSLVRWQNHWHVVRQSWPSSRTTSPGASPTA